MQHRPGKPERSTQFFPGAAVLKTQLIKSFGYVHKTFTLMLQEVNRWAYLFAKDINLP